MMNVPGPAPHVIVVGAGPSGLAAAHRLTRAGVRVRILDAADRLGGKMSTISRDGFVVDNGAFFLTSTYRNLLSIADEIGMGSEVVPGKFILSVIRNGIRHDIDGDHPVSSIATTKLLSPRAKAELIKLVPEVARSRSATYDRIATTGRFDGTSVSAWARSRLSPELQEYLIGALMRGISATNGETTSRIDFLALLNLLGGAKLLAFKHGMASYAERIAKEVEVDLGAEVVSVDTTDSGVAVTWLDSSRTQHVDHAQGCVVAVPGQVGAQIVAPLDVWRRDFLRSVHNNPLIVVNLGLSQRPKMETTYILVPQSAHPFITGVMLDHNKAPGRAPDDKGLISVALLDSWCRAHWGDDDTQICRAVLDGLDAIAPGLSATVEFTTVSRWHLEVNPIGFYRGLTAFRQLCDQDTRIQLAGDSHSMQNIEAATTTGLRAADRLLRSGLLRR